MKITVLNGSPKGGQSMTLQYVHFIQKKFPQHELKILNISGRIKRIEKNEEAFTKIMDQVRSSEAILWAFPLYVFLVHSGYKRFIELISERGEQNAFKGKYTAALSTSIHFFDHTAHNYMNAVCDDLDMKYTGGFSADTYDLMKEEERKRLILFFENFFESIENKALTPKRYRPLVTREFEYIAGNADSKIDTEGKRILILTDTEDGQTNLKRMIEKLHRGFAGDVEVINLHDVDIKGGCLGCVRCGFENKCAYADKDEFMEFYNTKLKPADVILFAGAIKDRYLSSRWKLFFDRSFFNCHSPSLVGKQLGFIISGPLSQIPNLREILEGWAEWQKTNLVDIVSDECADSAEIDVLLENLSMQVIRFAGKHYVKPSTFLGVAGMKIFRDNIWGRLRYVFRADHEYYKNHGIYDFPQKDLKSRIQNRILASLLKVPVIRKEFYNRLKAGMTKPLQKILEEA